MNDIIQGIAIYALPVIFAITLHEAAHGYAAKHFGDFTAHNEGRISLNPIRHIDPVGTILIPLSILLFSQTGYVMGSGRRPQRQFTHGDLLGSHHQIGHRGS